MNAHREEQLRIAEQAADWLRIMETAGPEEREAFTEWLHASPRHVRELLLMTAWDRTLSGIDPERRFDIEKLISGGNANVVPLRGMKDPHPGTSPSTAKTWRWVAAVAVIALLGALWRWMPTSFSAAPSYATAVGEQRTFELEDGSLVYLNTRSRVEVDFSTAARELRLVEGEALFKVTPDAKRPFRVFTDDAVVQAVGTQFNVYRRTDGTLISVVEGKVRVNDGPMLGAGEEITVTRDGNAIKQAASDVNTSIAWRERRLVFRKHALGDIAVEFNRYNAVPKIQVQGEALRARQFNGVFDADDPETFLRYLARDPTLAFDKQGDTIAIRER